MRRFDTKWRTNAAGRSAQAKSEVTRWNRMARKLFDSFANSRTGSYWPWPGSSRATGTGIR